MEFIFEASKEITEMCFFVWALNCLRPLSDIGDDEIQKMRDYLSK